VASGTTPPFFKQMAEIGEEEEEEVTTMKIKHVLQWYSILLINKLALF
jgi:hypothetical protein